MHICDVVMGELSKLGDASAPGYLRALVYRGESLMRNRPPPPLKPPFACPF